MKISVNPMQEQLEGIIKKKGMSEEQGLNFQEIILQMISMMNTPASEMLDHGKQGMGAQVMEGDLLENTIQSLQETSIHLTNPINREPVDASYKLAETLQRLMNTQKQPIPKDQTSALENNGELDRMLEKINLPLEELLLKLQTIKSPHAEINSKNTINFETIINAEQEAKENLNIDQTVPELDFTQEKAEKNESLIQNTQIIEKNQGEKSIEAKTKHSEDKNINESVANIHNLSFQEGIEHIDKELQQVEIQNIHDITEEMIKEIKVLKDGEHSKIQVKLTPKELGEIEIKLEMKEGQVLGKILVESLAIKGAVENQLQHLKQQLQDQNIVTQKIEVDLQQHSGREFQEHQAGLFWKEDLSSSHFTRQGPKGYQETLLEKDVGQPLVTNAYYSTGQASSINYLA